MMREDLTGLVAIDGGKRVQGQSYRGIVTYLFGTLGFRSALRCWRVGIGIRSLLFEMSVNSI